jgi:diguanylate cyclase (GGDEF)-like protein/PAS domain S-box-containing protein
MSRKIKESTKNPASANGQNLNRKKPAQKSRPVQTSRLQLHEKDFRGFIENLPVMFYAVETTPPYPPIYVSPAFAALGYPLAEWRKNPASWVQSIFHGDRERVLEITEKAIREGTEIDCEYRLTTKNGEIYWVRDRGSLIRNKEGKVIYWQGIIIDISEQKKVEEELKIRESLYRTISRNIPKTAIVAFDRELRFTLAEGEELEKVDLSSEKLEGKTLFEVFSGEAAEELERYYRVALAGGFISLEKEGSKRIIQNYILPLKDEKNEIYGGMSIWQDVTEAKRVNQKIQESEKRFREIFDGASDLIYSHDLQGRFLTMNSVAERVFGYTPEEILRLNIREVIAPEKLEHALQMIQSKLGEKSKQTIYELDCITKKGDKVTLEINSSLIFKDDVPVGVQGIARDITERKIAEKRIQESEAELRVLFSAMNDIVLVVDKRGKFLKIPQTSLPLPSVTPEEILGKTLHQVFNRRMANFFVKTIRKALRENEPQRIEYSVEIGGKTYWYSANLSPIYGESVLVVARDVTGRKNAEEILRFNEEKYRDLFENANDIIYTIDLDGYFTSLNRAGEKVSGYSQSEAASGKVHISQVVAPEFWGTVKKNIAEKLGGKESTTYQLDFIAKDGKRIAIELNSRIIFRDGEPIGMQGIGRNITDRKKAEEALKFSESQYRHLSEGIMHQVWTARPDGYIDFINSRGLEYFGTTLEKLDEIWKDVFHPEDLPNMLEHWKYALDTGAKHEVEFRLLGKDGEYRWHRSVATPGRDAEGKIVKWYGTNTDIHDQKIAEARLSHIAKHDSLTNLPNRAKFMSHLERVVNRKDPHSNQRFAVLFLDIDRFKIINDSLGHLIGDKLLIAFAERLESCVRPSDIVARLSGDEFTILLNNLEEFDDAIRVTNRLIQKLSEPFILDEYEVFTSASIGIVLSDEVKREPKDYLRDADTAMYRAKETGKARYELFNHEMHVRNMTLLRVENDLRKAIERNEFRVFYQPIVSLETGEIHEFEALVRWQHPEYGMVSPHEFIQVAEETGLIIPIGKIILEESCRQLAKWHKKFPQAKPVSIGVNLSSKQLMHPNLVAQVKEVLAKTGLNPRSLRLEVTETEVMENSEIALTVLNELKEIGVLLSTDDFGTGYSSLSYLHRFPFDCLKIDRSFVGDMDSNNKSAEIVRTILMLAQNLHLEVVAEGIETEEQLYLLQLQGCKKGQGYLFSKPVEAKIAEKLIFKRLIDFAAFNPYGFRGNVLESAEIQ